jgi:NRAMP (natural resistance-associated macrophage protein)-like metal ion transporter
MAGAAFGYGLLWTALLSLPLMVSVVQMMCGRLGMVTGRGLAGVIRTYYPRWVLWGACTLLVTANIINVAADLGGMGQGAELVTGINSLFWLPLFAAIITAFLLWSTYRQIARVFKWLTLVLIAYIGTAFYAHVDWRAAVTATFVPHFVWSRNYLALLLRILGATISPYLFFWQASQEVEEERAEHRATTLTHRLIFVSIFPNRL